MALLGVGATAPAAGVLTLGVGLLTARRRYGSGVTVPVRYGREPPCCHTA